MLRVLAGRPEVLAACKWRHLSQPKPARSRNEMRIDGLVDGSRSTRALRRDSCCLAEGANGVAG